MSAQWLSEECGAQVDHHLPSALCPLRSSDRGVWATGPIDEKKTPANTQHLQRSLTLGDMQLAREEALLFDAACSDAGNVFAQELLNVFGAQDACEVLGQLDRAPIGVFVDLISHLWYAVLYEVRRRDEYWGELLERAIG